MTELTELNFEETLSWRVSIVIAGYLILCQIAETALHHLRVHFSKSVDTLGLVNALNCLKDELLNVGFISIALVSTQNWIVNICVGSTPTEGVYCPRGVDAEHGRWLSSATSHCYEEDKEPFISATTLHQTHIMIFCIAMCHVFLTSVVMVLAQSVVKTWRWWESVHRDGKPPKEHGRAKSWTKAARKFCHTLMTCSIRNTDTVAEMKAPRVKSEKWWANDLFSAFLGQFFDPVTPSVFLSLRGYFLARYDLVTSFDFGLFTLRCCQRYMNHLFSIGWLWIIVLLEIISDGYGRGRYVPICFAIFFAFMVGYKLHKVRWELATYAHPLFSNTPTTGETRLKKHGSNADPRSDLNATLGLFWFRKPGLMLSLIRFIMFTAVVEVNFVVFYLLQRGWNSCFFSHYNAPRVLGRALAGLILLFYIAWFLLPSYTLVVQLAGDHSSVLVPRELQMQLKHMLVKVRNKTQARAKSVAPGIGASTISGLGAAENGQAKDGTLSSAAAQRPTNNRSMYPRRSKTAPTDDTALSVEDVRQCCHGWCHSVGITKAPAKSKAKVYDGSQVAVEVEVEPLAPASERKQSATAEGAHHGFRSTVQEKPDSGRSGSRDGLIESGNHSNRSAQRQQQLSAGGDDARPSSLATSNDTSEDEDGGKDPEVAFKKDLDSVVYLGEGKPAHGHAHAHAAVAPEPAAPQGAQQPRRLSPGSALAPVDMAAARAVNVQDTDIMSV